MAHGIIEGNAGDGDAIATPRSRHVSGVVDVIWDAGEGAKGQCSFRRWTAGEIVVKRGCCGMSISSSRRR